MNMSGKKLITVYENACGELHAFKIHSHDNVTSVNRIQLGHFPHSQCY